MQLFDGAGAKESRSGAQNNAPFQSNFFLGFDLEKTPSHYLLDLMMLKKSTDSIVSSIEAHLYGVSS